MGRTLRTLFAVMLALVAFAARAEHFVIPYGQQYVFEFTLRNANASAFVSGVVLTVGDCKVSKAGSADANCGTLPTAIASSNKYLFTVGATEAQASRIAYSLNDATGLNYFGREFTFDTCGNAAARFPTCPGAPPDVLRVGTCDGTSTNVQCHDTTLAAADNYYTNWAAIQLVGQPARCIRGYSLSGKLLTWTQTPAAASAANQGYAIISKPDCRNVP